MSRRPMGFRSRARPASTSRRSTPERPRSTRAATGDRFAIRGESRIRSSQNPASSTMSSRHAGSHASVAHRNVDRARLGSAFLHRRTVHAISSGPGRMRPALRARASIDKTTCRRIRRANRRRRLALLSSFRAIMTTSASSRRSASSAGFKIHPTA